MNLEVAVVQNALQSRRYDEETLKKLFQRIAEPPAIVASSAEL